MIDNSNIQYVPSAIAVYGVLVLVVALYVTIKTIRRQGAAALKVAGLFKCAALLAAANVLPWLASYSPAMTSHMAYFWWWTNIAAIAGTVFGARVACTLFVEPNER